MTWLNTASAAMMLAAHDTLTAVRALRSACSTAAVRAAAVREAIEGRGEGGADPAELRACQFRHLRHTAIAQLANAGVNAERIAQVTGHSVTSVAEILRHYIVPTAAGSRSALKQRAEQETER